MTTYKILNKNWQIIRKWLKESIEIWEKNNEPIITLCSPQWKFCDLYVIEQICNKSYKEEKSFVNFNLFNELICYRYESSHNYNKNNNQNEWMYRFITI